MNNETDSPLSSESLRGYNDAYFNTGYDNPWVELSPEWVEYDTGYDAGWTDRQEDMEYS